MARLVVVGGRGFFGAAAVALLRAEGEQPLVGARGAGGDLRMDAEDPVSLCAALRPGDVVIDAAGPFQRRTTTLAAVALELGCHLVDLADSLDHVLALQRLAAERGPFGTTGLRLLPACSAVSAVSAALVGLLAVPEPVRVSAFLVPASGNTATAATTSSLLRTLERPVRVLRAGRLVTAPAFSAARHVELPPPVGGVSGRLGESPDVVTLPASWPTLREVDFRVATRRRPLDHLLAAAARHPVLLASLRAATPLGRRLARWLGPRSGGFAVEVEAAGGGIHRAGFVHDRYSYLVAVAPAVLAARALAAGTFPEKGLVPAHRQVDPQRLRELLARHGVRYFADPSR
jgi:saccharopine dehydrogenase-like NADP-dependent oxidoreductase